MTLLTLASQAAAQEPPQVFADWTGWTLTSATFSLGGVGGTVVVTNQVNWTTNAIRSIDTLEGQVNYPATWYTPTPPAGTEWLKGAMNNLSSSSTGTADWVITFAAPVTDPRLHFTNLDVGVVDLGQTTDTGGNAVSAVRLSGNPELEVTGTVVNSTQNQALNSGCEDASGGNPNGACGTLQLVGTYSTLVLSMEDTTLATNNGDGFWLTISAAITNSAPTAEAGDNQSIHAGQTVFLDGTGSADLETDTADLTYAWAFLSKPAGSTAAFDDAASAMPSFVADQLGDYQIELTVTDEGGLSDSDQVTVTSENVPPQADAGADVVAIVGSLVTLGGGASSDADGDPLSYAWTLASSPTGSTAALVDANTQFPSITPDVPGGYDIDLVANDGCESSLPDTVTVSAITPEELALTVLMDASNSIAGLPDSSFDKKQDRKKSTNEIAKTIDKIQAGEIGDAVHFIDKLVERTDGCALRGSPDPHGGSFKHDYITNCADQAPVYDGLVAARDALAPVTTCPCWTQQELDSLPPFGPGDAGSCFETETSTELSLVQIAGPTSLNSDSFDGCSIDSVPLGITRFFPTTAAETEACRADVRAEAAERGIACEMRR